MTILRVGGGRTGGARGQRRRGARAAIAAVPDEAHAAAGRWQRFDGSLAQLAAATGGETTAAGTDGISGVRDAAAKAAALGTYSGTARLMTASAPAASCWRTH